MVAHGQQIGRLLSDVDVLSRQMNNYAVRVDEVEKDIEALKAGNPERASYVEATTDASDGVECDKPIPEGGRIRPKNRRESVGTNPPETTFTWTDLKGDNHFSGFDYCDQEVQTSLPSAHIPFVADAKIGEGVKAWRAGKYKTKSGGGNGGDPVPMALGMRASASGATAATPRTLRGTVVRRRV